jgi:uncharacterized protein (TIGR00297 family)
MLGEVRLTLAPLTNFDVGALASILAAYLALRFRALTAGGALAAFCVGTATFGALGGWGATILLTFFITSVALSRYGRRRKRALVDIGKSGPRDGMQVLANGGIAAACALLAAFWEPHYALGFAGAIAAANADTWGTEIGVLLGHRPRSILTLRPVSPGLSGGVTLAGTLAEFAGALVIAGAAAAAGSRTVWPVAFAGIAGALVDSLLGATLQALRWCPQCRRYCETEPHACGANTQTVRGLSWFGNDGVNFIATATGAIVALALTP